MSQAPKEETISKKEEMFTCIKYCRGAKREMMEAQYWIEQLGSHCFQGQGQRHFFQA